MENKYPRIGTAVIIVNKNGKILFSERLKGSGKGLLSIPGGKLEFDENIKDGMARETLEECGIDINKYSWDIIPIITKNITESNHYICFWSVVNATDLGDEDVKFRELDKNNRPKNSPWKFYSIDSIIKKNNIFNKTKYVIQQYFKESNTTNLTINEE